ncbi:hypothetical protein BD413DRAFT_610439 [Trametes elegans]|nr:hypothetical protein BD413DRAFT_610439 [Trametes elegans]
MWTVTGAFDYDIGDGPAPEKSKLLKPGKSYSLGRRDHPLQVRHKAISKNHAVFVVGECTEEQAADPGYVPTLRFENLTERKRTIERPTLESPRLYCMPHAAMELEDEDVVHLSASVRVVVRWKGVCCYNGSARAGPAVSVKECAALGIHVVPTLCAEVTHHLTPTYALSPAIATSLVSLATLVRPEWLIALLAAGKAREEDAEEGRGGLSPLEVSFALPPETKFRPAFAPALPPRLRKFEVWGADEERAGMFRGRRFVFVGERGAEAPGALRELVRRGEGEYECFAVEGGTERFGQVLAKRRAREVELVLVAERHAVVPVVGEDGWGTLVEEAKKFNLKFYTPENVVEAVVHTDISLLDSSVNAEDVMPESGLPDVIPNTYEDEPSVPPPARAASPVPQQESLPVPQIQEETPAPHRRLPRRATSRASSRGPSPPPPPPPVAQPPRDANGASHTLAPEAGPSEPAQPRRTLVRRAGKPKPIIGIDDTTIDIDNGSVSGRAPEEPPVLSLPRRAESIVPPTPARPSRLKRRVGTNAQNASSELFPGTAEVIVPDAEEPPHKKFKALFDESDPDRLAQMHLDEYSSQRANVEESMTQYEPSGPSTAAGTQARQSARNRTSGTTSAGVPLDALMEEEEESMLTLGSSARPDAFGSVNTQSKARGMKRKSQAVDAEGDVEMEEAPPRTRRRTGDDDSVPEETAQTQADAVPPKSKPLSKVVTREDMAQSQVHAKEKPAKKAGVSAKVGAEPGKPDKDAAFLKAVASTKRGKKTEDMFDREFNNLRISKPDLAQQKMNDEWSVLEEFGDDGDVRGNFMVVVEMPVLRKGAGREHLRRGEGRLEWQGRPDFKKFKRKNGAGRRHPVELVVEEEGDLGIGSQYWKGSSQTAPSGSGQLKSQVKAEESEGEKTTTTQRSTQRRAKSTLPTLVSDEEDEDGDERIFTPAPSKPPSSKSKSQGRGSKALPSTRASSRNAATRIASQKQPLFIVSDIEEENDDAVGEGMSTVDRSLVLEGEDEDSAGTTLMATSRSTQSRTTRGKKGLASKRSIPVVLDDDSDDGATFKALGARAKSRR